MIGMAAGRKYENYLKWIQQRSVIDVIKLCHEDNNLDRLNECDGIILTGGEDVHPRFYGKPEYVNEYRLNDFDIERDEFEMKAIDYSQRNEVPLLGICRGLQIVNVFFGGTLIPDIPSFGKPDHTKYEEGKDRVHPIEVTKSSFLESVTGVLEGEVNSAHHQSIARVGDGLVVNAVSLDQQQKGRCNNVLAPESFYDAVR